MPILFLVAGISSRLYLEKHTNKEFIKSRTVKLLVPSTIGLFAFQFLQGYVNMYLNNAFESLGQTPKVVTYFIMVLSGTGVLWFIQLLWIYSLILVLIRKIEKDRLLNVGAKTPIWMIILFFLPVAIDKESEFCRFHANQSLCWLIVSSLPRYTSCVPSSSTSVSIRMTMS